MPYIDSITQQSFICANEIAALEQPPLWCMQPQAYALPYQRHYFITVLAFDQNLFHTTIDTSPGVSKIPKDQTKDHFNEWSAKIRLKLNKNLKQNLQKTGVL